VSGILAGRPYADTESLWRRSDELTLALAGADLAEALAGHPRIGERADSAWSRQEQAGTASADAAVRRELAEANTAYEQRFGHVYLVCATGRSAEELLAICRARLDNDPQREDDVVREELAKINRIRLDKLLGAGT
jgi:2-oxo-4-hydroxy-4-carboxy-5-ureidoimidazoline decarboxylase